MIERTFLHLPGVGRTTEQRLWDCGFECWDQLWEALSSGAAIRELLRPRPTQRDLFPDLERRPSDRRSLLWLDVLDNSRKALFEQDYPFFLDRLFPCDHWRLLVQCLSDALYLDIETTGLSHEMNYVTVIGAAYQGNFYQWVWPESVTGLRGLIEQAPLLVTFNGRRFDAPFLRAHGLVPAPNAHIDLLYLARAAGLRGGQKEVERGLGLTRDQSIGGVDGEEAVALWCRSLYGDRQSFLRLLAYNRMDVEMLPEVAERLCTKLASDTVQMSGHLVPAVQQSWRVAHSPASFAALQKSWLQRRAGLHLLRPRLLAKMGREPVVVGIDLRGNPQNPSGWARCVGEKVETRIVHSDEEILDLTRTANPDLVSIDAPLSLPRGRRSVSDDSPCRRTGGIVRDVERILWSRRIPVYPALIKSMQELTRRGIELASSLRREGIAVIESYPGAAQDVLGIVRKRDDAELLYRGLSQFGFRLRGNKTHDELDAVTSALVGYFFLADDYEAVGADDEGYLIIPRWAATMRWTNE